MAERRIGLRPVQSTQQVDISGPTRISSYAPKANPVGNTKQEQLSKALMRLAPSLTEALSTGYEAYKGEEIKRGQTAFNTHDPKSREWHLKKVKSGELEATENPHFVYGYQQRFLKSLTRDYVLGISQLLNSTDLTENDQALTDAFQDYDQKFNLQYSIASFDKGLVNSVLVPRMDTAKESVMQNWDARRKAVIEQEAWSNYQSSAKEILQRLLDKNISFEELGAEYIEDIDEFLGIQSIHQRIKNRKVVIDLPLLEGEKPDKTKGKRKKPRKLTDKEYEEIRTKYRSDFASAFEARKRGGNVTSRQLEELVTSTTNILEDTSLDPSWRMGLIQESRSKSAKLIATQSKEEQDKELLGVAGDIIMFQDALEQEIQAMGQESGNVTKANELAVESIANLAIEHSRPELLNLVHVIKTKDGASYGNTVYSVNKVAQARKQIKQNETTAFDRTLRLEKLLKEKTIDHLSSNLSSMLIDNKVTEVEKESRFKASRKLFFEQGTEGITAWNTLDKLYNTENEDLRETEWARLEEDISLGNLSDIEFISQFHALNAKATPKNKRDFNDYNRIQQSSKRLNQVFKDGSGAKNALKYGLNYILGRTLGSDTEVNDWRSFIATLNRTNPQDLSRYEAGLQFRSQLKRRLLSHYKTIQDNDTNLSEADLLDSVDEHATKIFKETVESVWTEPTTEDTTKPPNQTNILKNPYLLNKDEEVGVNPQEVVNYVNTYLNDYVDNGEDWTDRNWSNNFDDLMVRLLEAEDVESKALSVSANSATGMEDILGKILTDLALHWKDHPITSKNGKTVKFSEWVKEITKESK